MEVEKQLFELAVVYRLDFIAQCPSCSCCGRATLKKTVRNRRKLRKKFIEGTLDSVSRRFPETLFGVFQNRPAV